MATGSEEAPRRRRLNFPKKPPRARVAIPRPGGVDTRGTGAKAVRSGVAARSLASPASADEDSRTSRRQYRAGRARDGSDAGGMSRHVTDTSGRKVADQHRRRSFRNHARTAGHAPRQHARGGHVGHAGGRQIADEYGRCSLDDDQWEGWMGHWSRNRSRGVDRSVAMRSRLQRLIGHSCGRLTHETSSVGDSARRPWRFRKGNASHVLASLKCIGGARWQARRPAVVCSTPCRSVERIDSSVGGRFSGCQPADAARRALEKTAIQGGEQLW